MIDPEGPEKDGLPLKAKLLVTVWRPGIRHLRFLAEERGISLEEAAAFCVDRDRRRVAKALERAKEPPKPKKKRKMPYWLRRKLYG